MHHTRLLILLAAVALPAHAAPMIVVSDYTPQFVGIDQTSATIVDAGLTSVAYIDRVNLGAPGIGFAVTPQSGTMQTTSQTTSQFLLSSRTQAAINANFFAPCCDTFAEPKSLVGLSVASGNVVSEADYGSDDAASSLLISAGNQASILEAQPSGSTVNLQNVANAVSGNLIVSAGQNVSSVVPTGAPHDPFGLDPRTDVGLSQNGQYLYLAVIDGRQTGYSAGVTDSDAAQLLIDLGVYEGLNLDGGGSTALVQSDGIGGSAVINNPSGGTERYDGNNFGVSARALQVPEPSSVLLAGTSLIVLAACGRGAGRSWKSGSV